MIMNNSPQIYVSVDIGCRQHSVAIGLSNGDVLDEFAIFHRPEGFKQFFERIEHHRQRHGGAVAVAMEGYNASPKMQIIFGSYALSPALTN